MSCSVEVWSWSDLDPGWPAAYWSWSHSDLESLLRWLDDLLKALDAPLGWPDPAEWQWPDPDPLSWPDERWPAGHIPALFIGCIATPDSACITGGPPAGGATH